MLEGDEIDKAFLDPKNRGGLLASEVQARLGNTIDTDADKLPEELGELQKEASIQAVRGGGEGDVSKTHVLWLHKTRAPSHIVSPLVADGRMFLIKQGGITVSFDIAKGQPVWERRRVGADGSYLAASVFGDGKIYVVSEPGVVSVIESGPEQKFWRTMTWEKPSRRLRPSSTARSSSVLAPNCIALQIWRTNPATGEEDGRQEGCGKLRCFSLSNPGRRCPALQPSPSF